MLAGLLAVTSSAARSGTRSLAGRMGYAAASGACIGAYLALEFVPGEPLLQVRHGQAARRRAQGFRVPVIKPCVAAGVHQQPLRGLTRCLYAATLKHLGCCTRCSCRAGDA